MLSKIASATALIVSLIAAFAAGIALQQSKHTPVQGVCVMYDVNTVGTMVESAVINSGTIMCESGSFVSVIPSKSKKAE